MGLSEIVGKHIRSRKTGLLSIKIERSEYLMKVYLEGGQVVALSHGTCHNEECLTGLKRLVPGEHFFVEGAKPITRAESPLTDRFLASAAGGGNVVHPAPGASAEKVVPASAIEALSASFTDELGPIAPMLLDRLFARLSYERGSSMTAGEYSFLLEAVLKELPLNRHPWFRNKHEKR